MPVNVVPVDALSIVAFREPESTIAILRFIDFVLAIQINRDQLTPEEWQTFAMIALGAHWSVFEPLDQTIVMIGMATLHGSQCTGLVVCLEADTTMRVKGHCGQRAFGSICGCGL